MLLISFFKISDLYCDRNSGGGKVGPMGVSDGKLHPSQISTSSVYDGDIRKFGPQRIGLYGRAEPDAAGGWCAASNSQDEYVIVSVVGVCFLVRIIHVL